MWPVWQIALAKQLRSREFRLSNPVFQDHPAQAIGTAAMRDDFP